MLNAVRIAHRGARHPVPLPLPLRAYATFVPPSSTRSISQPEALPHPSSPSFFTGRPKFHDTVIKLESVLSTSRRELTHANVLPIHDAARRAVVSNVRTAWKSPAQLTDIVGAHLRTGQYRQVTGLLNQLNELRVFANKSQCVDIERKISDFLALFEREDKEAVLGSGKKPVQFDEYGRSYTLGKRKESAARVWIIPVQKPTPPAHAEPAPVTVTPTPAAASSSTDVLDVDSLLNDVGSSSTPAPLTPIITPTTVLINNLPLATYFSSVADRERVLRPLKLAGLLGAYNVFALVRGGGTTGQAGATAHGIAKGLVAHEPDVARILNKARLTRRDPRMVERKKTGLAKARKRYAWVKR
ncbi:hypothetical protein BOTBODRAFT_99876 [Botryobasidium botryosum FD-172 SS1]|uniref:Ribosomal protein S5 domain 2-like protein n=1 Tax=Botryobasidium botryosum (strain FD-172 SS1) TaxID=930990 RepID=A0A067N353_BOTB1|nr:hypothetical protein BOTBODRAFT_99876 [Botryobasidium botryosum FD-172 SS1]